VVTPDVLNGDVQPLLVSSPERDNPDTAACGEPPRGFEQLVTQAQAGEDHPWGATDRHQRDCVTDEAHLAIKGLADRGLEIVRIARHTQILRLVTKRGGGGDLTGV
jgi:hypothetical protein